MPVEPQTPRRSIKRKLSFASDKKTPLTPAKVRVIARKVIASNEEIKHSITRDDFFLNHNLARAYFFGYVNPIGGIPQGVDLADRISDTIKLDHINIDVFVETNNSNALCFDIGLYKLPYQATAYTYNQIFQTHDLGSAPNLNGFICQPTNTNFVNDVKGYRRMVVDNPLGTINHAKWIRYRIPCKQLFKYQIGSQYSMSGHDWYVVVRACGIGIGAVVTDVGSATVTCDVRFTDA